MRVNTFVTGIFVVAIAMGIAAKSYSTSEDKVPRAQAQILGAPGSGISGVVTFTEEPADKYSPVTTVKVVAHIVGLPPGLHGMHVHENGSCANTTVPFGGAGGHFDPGPFGGIIGGSNPDTNHPFHMGDLPNLEVNPNGVGHLEYTTSRITLSPGPLSVFDDNGSAVVVHLNKDLGGPGAAGSGMSGGPRIACGVIN
jgi:Cu-Zn family superoxide dismutase